MQKRVLENPKIRTMMNFRVNRWLGNGKMLQGAQLVNCLDDTTTEVKCSGAFIAIGHKPKTEFLGDKVMQPIDC